MRSHFIRNVFKNKDIIKKTAFVGTVLLANNFQLKFLSIFRGEENFDQVRMDS